MERVLDTPVRTNSRSHRLRIYREAADVISTLDRRLVADGARALDLDDALRVLPRVDALDPIDMTGHANTPTLGASVSILLGHVFVLDDGLFACDLRERDLQRHTQRWLVLFHSQYVAGARIDDVRSDRLLTSHRVDSDRRAANVDGLEQLWNRSDLVGLVIHSNLTERQTKVRHPGTDDMKRALATATIERSAHRLAIDRNNLPLKVSDQILKDGRDGSTELLRTDRLEDSPKCVLTRHAVRKRKKRPQPGQAGLRECLHVAPRRAAVDGRKHGDDQ